MDDSPFEQPVMLGEASMELTPTSTQQRRDDPQLQVKQLELGIASTEIYLEHGCFEMPVLQVSSLLVAQRERRAPFAPNSLLHHALVAAAIPWLGNDVLESYGYSSRDEALGHTIEDFEKLLQVSIEKTELEELQALLLVLYGSSQASIKRQQSREANWLRKAISRLRDALCFFNSGKAFEYQRCAEDMGRRSQKRLLHRVWWCTLLAEQTYFLRYSLEAGEPSSLPPILALDPRGQKPLEMSDMDLTRYVTPLGYMSADWNRLQRAACFIEKTHLFGHLACTLLTRPKLQVYSSPPKFPRTGYICHNERFWIVQAMEDQFLRYLNDNRLEDGLFPDDESLIHQQTDLILVFCRVLIALCRSPHQSTEPDRWIWQQLRYESVTRSTLKILNIGRRALTEDSRNRMLHGRTSSLLRALTVSIRIATSKEYNLSIASKRQEMHTILDRCLHENESFWSGPLSDECCRLNTPALAESTETSTPAPDYPNTPSEIRRESPLYLDKSTCEHLTEQHDLLTRFDDMWNDEMSRHLAL